MARRLDINPTTAFWIFVGLLLACGTYFAIDVELRRAERRKAPVGLTLLAGAPVELVTVIDGDEITARAKGQAFVLRLLGVKCPFSDGDGTLAPFGRRCRAALEAAVAPRELTLAFDGETAKADKHGRILAYLLVGGRDVGEALVRQGALVPFTAYPFGREAGYLDAQADARKHGRGIWSDGKASAQVDAMQRAWAARREDAP